jgi:3-isopropylmalate/(R)-2-methylmalate dehydratase small subunit
MVTRSGYGDLLFSDVRGNGFPLDEPEAQGASILVVGTNFGCGSSREHAVWAIQQAGFACVIAKATMETPGYSDIFRQNSANCGLLLIELAQDAHQVIAGAGSGATVRVDLPNQTVTIGDEAFAFHINPATKDALVQGLDLIGTTLTYAQEIADFEAKSQAFVPVA